jgi:hypothetical protein
MSASREIVMPGPYVLTAVVCEKVLREGDNVLSLIRIVDRITVLTSDPSAGTELEGRLQITYVAVLRSGDARAVILSPLRSRRLQGLRCRRRRRRCCSRAKTVG